jgi:hypothetical protein
MRWLAIGLLFVGFTAFVVPWLWELLRWRMAPKPPLRLWESRLTIIRFERLVFGLALCLVGLLMLIATKRY